MEFFKEGFFVIDPVIEVFDSIITLNITLPSGMNAAIGKRSKDLLKVKKFFDDEYEVVDTEMGPFRYVLNGREQEESMLSCVMIQHKDHIVRVGSGFSIEQRQEFYKNPKKILGKQITVQYFEETKNQDGGISLRFPTFKILHGSARTV